MSEYVIHYRAKQQHYCVDCGSEDVRVRRWDVECRDCGHHIELP